MVTTYANRVQHNLEMGRRHLLEQIKTHANSNDEFTTEIARLMEYRLIRVEQALQKIEAGTYGLCESCGQPIEPERLEALPEASLCYRCKSRSQSHLL